MATRPKGYGMTRELQKKKDAKFDPELEREALDWLAAVTGTERVERTQDLKDGVVLCKAMNAVSPGSVKKINESKMAFKQMENIGNFLTAAGAFGCQQLDMFQTVDLYEAQNIPQVIGGIHAFGRRAHANGFDGPVLGVAEAEANHRDFSEAKLRAGEAMIGMQAGTNKGANQSGMNFGLHRQVAPSAASPK